MKREEFLKMLMVQKYGNVKVFSEKNGIPYSTVRSILKRGVGNSSVDNIIFIAKALDIPVELLEEEEIDISLINNYENPIINATVDIMKRLNASNQEKILTYAKERQILEEAEK